MDSKSSATVGDLMDTVRNNQMKYRIDSFLHRISKSCREKYALEAARNLVPISEMVQDNLSILEGDYQDNLLPVLVDWFNNEFFRWFTPPKCQKCSSNLDSHRTYISVQGLQVETYRCINTSCDYVYEFVRHNDPAILLTTRQGRCGEWANAFFLILRAMDYDARIVLDTTDHVWNEVWSEEKAKWIHVDPCENCVDLPLLYEVGWSKKLEYCIGFSQYEVIDVTRRYALDFKDTLRRRKACDEVWLERYTDKVTDILLNDETKEFRYTVMKRRAIDKCYMRLIALNPQKVEDKSKFQGRKTGSINWRIKRGEYVPVHANFSVIKVCESQNDDVLFKLTYNSQKNVYESPSKEYCKAGWASLTYSYENVDYKYERDWKTSYLSRYESCSCDKDGKIQWRFDLSGIQSWKRIEIFFKCQTYPNTFIDICALFQKLCDDSCKVEKKIEPDKVNLLIANDLDLSLDILDVIVTLSGGEASDAVAWQKPQLFRETLGAHPNEWSLKFQVY